MSSEGQNGSYFIKHSIGKSEHLSKRIEPAMQESKEGHQEQKRSRQSAVENRMNEHSQANMLRVEVAKDWNAESLKDVVGVQDGADNLSKIVDN